MKILFATDGSDSAESALDFLLRFPFPSESEVLVTTVIDRTAFPDAISGMLAGVPPDGDLGQTTPASAAFADEATEQRWQSQQVEVDNDGGAERTVRSEAEAHLTRVSERLRDAGWASSTEIRSGHPVDQICTAAEASATDLIVVGAHGVTGIRRHLIGSVSTGVLHYAGCSVLLVPHPDLFKHAPPSTERPLRFLLPHDGSEPSDRALKLCASLPLQGRATVTLLRVLELVTLYHQDLWQQMSRDFQEEKRAAEEELRLAAERLRQATSQVEVELLESGDLGRAILDTAAEHESDLIILGHKGRSAIKRMLVGSVIGRIAAHAHCAVLTVR
jgi:nucleotide-binding universal stress UspA family protein